MKIQEEICSKGCMNTLLKPQEEHSLEVSA